MGLLDKLWDDTLAGPRPDSGLGRLRKPPSFSSSSSSSSPGVVSPVGAATPTSAASAAAAAGRTSSIGEGISVITGPQMGEETKVTRSIMIKRPPGWSSPGSGTPPSSPASSTPPLSPFAVGAQRFRRKSMSDSLERRRSPSELPAADSSSSSTYPPFDV